MTPATLLFLGLLPATVAGSGEVARLQLDLAPELLLASYLEGSVVSSQVLRLGGTLFLRPVTDDATPLPLQPFLQRTSTLSVRLGGSRRAVGSGSELGGAVDADLDVYLLPYLPVSASVGAGGLRISGFEDWSPLPSPLRVAATVGLRAGDLRVDLGYRYMPRADVLPSWQAFHPLPEGAPLGEHGAITLSLRTVLVERIDIGLRLALALSGDLYGSFRSDYHPSRRLGLLWGIDFAHGARAAYLASGLTQEQAFVAPVFHRFGALFGLSWWWSRRVGLTGRYAADWYFPTAPDQTGAVGQRLDLELSTRI